MGSVFGTGIFGVGIFAEDSENNILTAIEIIELRAPEMYTAVGLSKLTSYIALAKTRISSTVFFDAQKYEIALALLVMHQITTTGGSSAGGSDGTTAGAVVAEKEGEISKSYSGFSQMDKLPAFYSGSAYGAELYSMIRSIPRSPIMR